MRAHIKSDFERGRQEGISRTLMFYTLAAHNVYGFGSGPLQRLLTEAGRIAEEAATDKDWFDKMKSYLHNLGVEINAGP
jgi:hypothetical protein